MTVMLRVSAAGLVAALALCGCSAEPSIDPTGTVREPIAGGVLDREHDEVIELITEWSSSSVAVCTGVLIAPNLVLTARHCVARGGGQVITCGSATFSAPVAASALHATADDAPTQSSSFYSGSRVTVPPDGDDVCGFDMALVTLAENVPPDVARPAVPRIDLRAVTGESYVAFGYGVDELGNHTGGRMRLDGLVVQCTGDRCAGFGVADNEFLGQEGVCSGDSGGPALDLSRRVIGVLSRGSDPCATPVYGSVAGFRDWIMATAVAAAETGGYPPPFWALSGSSDRPPGAAGDACASADECGGGTVCYYESDPLDAVCTAPCASDDECTAPSRCVPGFDVPGGGLCLTERRVVDDPPNEQRPPGDSCSVRSGGGDAASPFATALALVALTLMGRRRRT
jgi:MYXO-CTERM domain-containing protein